MKLVITSSRAVKLGTSYWLDRNARFILNAYQEIRDARRASCGRRRIARTANIGEQNASAPGG
jgi:hypothetical protein